MGLFKNYQGRNNASNKRRLTVPPTLEIQETAFEGSYRRFQATVTPLPSDLDTFFNKEQRQAIKDLIKKQLESMSSVKVQTTAWVKFIKEEEEPAVLENDKAFNSKMESVHQ